jgi:hypothetical protein
MAKTLDEQIKRTLRAFCNKYSTLSTSNLEVKAAIEVCVFVVNVVISQSSGRAFRDISHARNT